MRDREKVITTTEKERQDTIMRKISVTQRTLHFRQPAGTSRGTYTTRTSWFLEMTSDDAPGRSGTGECAPLPDLSCDASPAYEQTLKALCRIYETRQSIDYSLMRPYPSMLFGMETAERNFEQGGSVIFDTPFTRGEEGIPINGLVWMGSLQEMMSRLEEKMQAGFACVKLKIGAIDFDDEMRLIRHIRNRFGKEYIELRVDANGGFSPDEAPQRLEQLAAYDIHSIEQPIRQRQWTEMARLCRESPLPIALDEELIGVNSKEMKTQMLDFIRPQYIILKPSLHGGMHGTREWKELADKRGIGSWITSALESNVGLNAVAQLAASVYGPGITTPQGLGTGQLFTDNLPMPLEIRKDRLWRVP